MRAQRGDPHMRRGDSREEFLLDAPVFAGSGDEEAETVAIKGEARVCIVGRDPTVVDAEKEPSLFLPAQRALARRKLDQLERVAIRIAEIDRADAAGVWVPGGKGLRPGPDRRRARP